MSKSISNTKLTQSQTDRIIQMAWEDRTTFDAISVGGNSNVRSVETTFTSNTASNSGGAVYVLGAGRFISRQSSFLLNTAESGEGGAIANFGIANIGATSFSDNRAQRGGAIKVGGEQALLSVSASSSFDSNVAAKNGSAISSTTSSITLIDGSFFMDNVIEDGFGDELFKGEVRFHRVTNSTFG